MGELIAEIENNFVEYVVVRSAKAKEGIEGLICEVQDKNIVFDLTELNAKKFFKIWTAATDGKLYNVSFKLNRLHYQLQHYALEFILDHELFVRLIDNSDYRGAKPPQIRKVDAKSNRLK